MFTDTQSASGRLTRRYPAMDAMHEYETWLDIECPIDGEITVACTLFARLSVSIPFVEREVVTFWPKQENPAQFWLVLKGYDQQVHYAPTEVDDISRNFHGSEHGVSCSFCLHFRPVRAKSEQDARLLVEFLVAQHGFELDSYGPKRLYSGVEG